MTQRARAAPRGGSRICSRAGTTGSGNRWPTGGGAAGCPAPCAGSPPSAWCVAAGVIALTPPRPPAGEARWSRSPGTCRSAPDRRPRTCRSCTRRTLPDGALARPGDRRSAGSWPGRHGAARSSPTSDWPIPSDPIPGPAGWRCRSARPIRRSSTCSGPGMHVAVVLVSEAGDATVLAADAVVLVVARRSRPGSAPTARSCSRPGGVPRIRIVARRTGRHDRAAVHLMRHQSREVRSAPFRHLGGRRTAPRRTPPADVTRGDAIMIKGFKDFILRGNVIDLAVAVVIGAAFTALVAAVTANLIQPVLNAFGGVDTGSDRLLPQPEQARVLRQHQRDPRRDHHLPDHRAGRLLRLCRADEEDPGHRRPRQAAGQGRPDRGRPADRDPRPAAGRHTPPNWSAGRRGSDRTGSTSAGPTGRDAELAGTARQLSRDAAAGCPGTTGRGRRRRPVPARRRVRRG